VKRWHPLVAAVAAAVPLAATIPGTAAHADGPPSAQQVDQQLAQLLSGQSSQGTLNWKQKAAAEANWVLAAQLPDGAITQYVDRQKIDPYLANYAVMGLATADRVTGQATYAQASWSWLRWYAAHEGPQGFVTDYTVAADGTETSTGEEDSTDAYAGTYLLATEMTYAVDKDSAALHAVQPGLVGALHAIEATDTSDGMTWAVPSYHMKYLMDEAEVYAGLRAATHVFTAEGDTADAAAAHQLAGQLRHGVQQLWDSSDGAFDWAKADDGTTTSTNWNTLYPDTMEQAWAVGLGLADKAQASAIESHLRDGAWQHPASTAPFQANGTQVDSTVGYWPLAGLAVGASPTSISPVRGPRNSILSAAVNAQFGWPFTTATMGQLMLLRRTGLALKQAALNSGTDTATGTNS
jgi:hypothetical protein